MNKEEYTERFGIAYHEAGHSLSGFQHGHTTNFIDINLDPQKKVYPNVDKSFGVDEPTINEIHNVDITALNQRNFNNVLEVAKRYCEGLLAGTMAEYWYLHKGNPKFEQINKNDKCKVRNCINVIYKLSGNQLNRNDFLNERMNNTRDFICNTDNFNKIQKIANALMNSKNFRVEKELIEKLIK